MLCNYSLIDFRYIIALLVLIQTVAVLECYELLAIEVRAIDDEADLS